MRKGKCLICPKCQQPYSWSAKPGNCTVCLLDRVEIVRLVEVQHTKTVTRKSRRKALEG